jgi:hypothetical protein
MAQDFADLERILTVVSEALATHALDPDPARGDWSEHRATLNRLKDEVERVLSVLVESAAGDEGANVRAHAVVVASELAGVLAAAGRDGEAQSLLRAAEGFAGNDERDICRAGRADLRGFALLCRATWLLRHKRNPEAQRVLAEIARSATDPVLRDQARAILDVPQPIKSAPSLFTLNGVGFRMWGDRDRAPDGSYIATWGLVLLFIPLLPLRAYRVIRQGNRYLFLGRVPLGAQARLARSVVGLAVLVAVAGGIGYAWWDGADHRASQALAVAAKLEQPATRDQAIAAYERVASDFDDKVDAAKLARAGAGVVRNGLLALPSPFGEQHVDAAARLVRRYQALPPAARPRETTLALADGLTQKAQALGDGTPARAAAALRLFDLAYDLGPDAAQQVAGPRSALRQHRIQALAADWPLDALALAADALDDAAAQKLAQSVLAGLGSSPSLLLDAQPDVEALLHVAEIHGQLPPDLLPVQAALKTGLAWRDDAARTHALQEGDQAALRRRAAAHPDDQEVALALAAGDFGHGDVEGARRRLATLGAPGHTIAEAQRFAASLAMSRDNLAEAEAILSAHVAARLPRFVKASQAYEAASSARSKDLIEQLQRGPLPDEIKAAGEDETRQRNAVRAWIAARLEMDAGLTRVKESYLRHAAVVPAVLTLGRLELQRARTAPEAARGPLLAEAERLFLSIRAEAEGQPGFHLGLGQVYHRLGRPDEGDAELAKLLDGPPEQRLAVAGVYRDLGLERKAIELVEKVYADGDEKSRQHAAIMRALMSAGLDEREQWLKKSDARVEEVALGLEEIRAERALAAGHDQDAARSFADVAAKREREAAHNPVAANNAAVAHESRYRATGDIKDLEHGLRLLENAYRAQSDSALVALNLSRVLTYTGLVRVLARFTPVAQLRPSDDQADHLASALLSGPQRDAVLAAVRSEPLLLRAAQIDRQAEVLAPQRIDAYDHELDLTYLTDDDQAVLDLEARLKAQPTLDVEEEKRRFARYMAGEFEPQTRQFLSGELAREAKALEDAHKRHDTRAEGFLLFLRGASLERRGYETGELADLVESARVLEEARRRVPELGQSGRLWSLAVLAVARAAESDAGVAKLWKERRGYNIELLLLALRDGAGGTQRLAALRKQPELGEAAALARADVSQPPAMSLLVLARVAGDEALAAREAPVLMRPSALATKRIRARLRGFQPGSQIEVQFAQNGGK